jgi:hypothetical protein
VPQRHSEFERVAGDDYATPSWVTEALCAAENFRGPVWEVAPGAGFMIRALQGAGHEVVTAWSDFLAARDDPRDAPPAFGSIITNPPFGRADEFISRALELALAAAALPLTRKSAGVGWRARVVC